MQSWQLTHQSKILLLSLVAGAPAVIVSMLLLWLGDFTPKVQWTLSVLILGCWIGFSSSVKERVVRPLQTIANLLAALREGDYSIRAHTVMPKGDALSEVSFEINEMEGILRGQRLDAVEATALVRRVIDVIDVAIFAFDSEQKLQLVNRAAEMLLASPSERLLGRQASKLGLTECLEGPNPRTIQKTFPGKTGRWGLRRSTFREGGRPHQLIALADLSKALREEERQAWQRLVRVLGHELNNSLAPIKSMAGSLATLLTREPRVEDWEDDMKRGLAVINNRADSLTRFMKAYSQMARLPEPKMRAVEIGPLLTRVASFESRAKVEVQDGPLLTIEADSDQLEQLLINLIKNAVEASRETDGGVSIAWGKTPAMVRIWVRDQGHGLPNTSNLFVPFFTTKPKGSGIGLVLSRQIAEAHGGTLTLQNRTDEQGCEACLELPRYRISSQSSQGPYAVR